jgi:hypothetical protein
MMFVSTTHKFKQIKSVGDRFKRNFLLVIQKSGNSNYETDFVVSNYARKINEGGAKRRLHLFFLGFRESLALRDFCIICLR